MARGKTKIARIEDEKVLKSTFKKRKNGLIKKVQELTILCDIIACVIIYAPVIGGRPPEIFTWPEDQEKVRAAIRMYQEKQAHYKRTAELCNILKNRRRLGMSESDHHPHHQLNYMTMSGGGFYENHGMPPEAVLAYLNWVDARIKAVDERIELVKNSGNMMLFGNDQCHTLMFDDKMMVTPVHGYGTFPQFDPYAYDQTQCGRGGYNIPMYLNLVPEASHFQQSNDLNGITGYQQIQTPNQTCSYDPYLLEIERSNTMRMSINSSVTYHQQQEQNQQQHGEQVQCWNSVTQIQSNGQNLMSGKIDDFMQLCEEWSSPDAASSSSSNRFNKSSAVAAAAAAVAAALDDPLDYFLNTAELIDELLSLEDAAGGNVPNQNGA